MNFVSRLLPIALAASLSACVATLSPLSEADLSDSGIRARLEATLKNHREIDMRYVTMDIHARIVTFSGIIRTPEEKQLIRTLAEETKGVDQFIVNLVVKD